MEPVLHFHLWQLIVIGGVTLLMLGVLKKLFLATVVLASLGFALGMLHLQPAAPYVKLTTPAVAAPSSR